VTNRTLAFRTRLPSHTRVDRTGRQVMDAERSENTGRT
jgi:hypothetical protein